MGNILQNPVALAGWVLVMLAGGWTVMAISTYFRRQRLLSDQYEKEILVLEERLRLIRERQRKTPTTAVGWEGFANFVVTKKIRHGKSGICSFYLKPKDERLELAAFQPGQHLVFQLPISGKSQPITRRYSLSDRSGLGHYRVSVKLLGAPETRQDLPPGLGSSYFHKEVHEEGASALPSLIQVSSPAGSFALDPFDSKPVVLIGGGVGITPMLSMFNSIVEANESREVWLFYVVRNTEENILFDEDMLHPNFEKFVSERRNFHLQIYFTRLGLSEEFPDGISGRGADAHRGHLTVERMKEHLPSNNFQFYICGPEGMMDRFEQDLVAWGVPEEEIFSERFQPPSKRKPAADAVSGSVTFAKSGKRAEMGPEDLSILDLASRSGVPISFDCRAGSCGQCKVSLVSGKVKYNIRTNYKCPPGSCLTCCSLPEGDVVVDC